MLLLKKYNFQLLVAIVFSLLFYWFGYEITRDEEIQLFLFFTLAFSLYFLLGFKISYNKLWLKTKHIILIAIVARCVLLFMTPNLSDDFYRFYWDGNVVMDGENPYKQIPSFYEFRDPEKNKVKTSCFLGGFRGPWTLTSARLAFFESAPRARAFRNFGWASWPTLRLRVLRILQNGWPHGRGTQPPNGSQCAGSQVIPEETAKTWEPSGSLGKQNLRPRPRRGGGCRTRPWRSRWCWRRS